jgi:carbamoyltransferase
MQPFETFIIGVSFGYQESAVAVLKGETVIFASSEERFSRLKNDPKFPSAALEYVQKRFSLDDNNIEAICYYENPAKKIRRIFESQKKNNSRDITLVLRDWVLNRKSSVCSELSRFFGVSCDKIFIGEHHRSHAAAAFYSSPFSEATVLTIDGVGESQTSTVYKADREKLKLVSESVFPNSLGLTYAAFTRFLGFKSNEDEYKVMGLAAYGEPVLKNEVLKMVTLQGSVFNLNTEFLNFSNASAPWTKKFRDVFGEPIGSGWRFSQYSDSDFDKDPLLMRAANIASSLQNAVEEIIVKQAIAACEATGVFNLCYSGGVALNGMVNDELIGKISGERGGEVFIYPAPGDAGSAVGAALDFRYRSLADEADRYCAEADKTSKTYQPKFSLRSSVYVGYDIADDQNASNLEKSIFYTGTLSDNELSKKISSMLFDDKIVGWVRGSAEWGPRALGNRSILASPIRAEIKTRVNASIKYRERYRPFAPIVLEEWADRIFCVRSKSAKVGLPTWSPYRFMMVVADVCEEWKSKIPGVVHQDGTARVQVLSKSDNLVLYELLMGFFNLSGVPVLLNTSFNLNSEPIVNTAADAYKAFELSDLDVLVIGNRVFEK